MEVFHYMAEKLRVYPLFENGNKSIKINEEREAVYNDFDFDSTELLSECSSNINYLKTLVRDTNDVFSLNSAALVPQMHDPLIMPYWKQIKTTAFDHWLLIILITIFHQVHQAKST